MQRSDGKPHALPFVPVAARPRTHDQASRGRGFALPTFPTRLNLAMTEPPLDPWMTSSRGPFLTLNTGGPLSGIVTITALPERGAHLIVDANWRTIHGEPRTASTAIDGYSAARELAHEWADQLAAGYEPDPT